MTRCERGTLFDLGLISSSRIAVLCAFGLAGALATGAFAFCASLSPINSIRQPRLLQMSASTARAETKAVVVGGGPAGALMAIYLAKDRGFKVDLFERLEEARISGPTVRAWNVVLFERGLAAMEGAGLDIHSEAGKLAIRLTGSQRHQVNKSTSFFNGTTSICRGDFAKALTDKAAGLPNVDVHYGCSLRTLDIKSSVATFERGNGESVEVSYDMLVGADGVNSRVRSTLEESIPDFTVRQREDHMAFKTIPIPIMSMTEAEEGWRTKFHTINSKIGCLLAPARWDGMMTAVVIQPREGATSFESLMKTPQDVREFFVKWYPNVFGPGGPSEEVSKDFLGRRPQFLKSTYCSHLAHDNVVLIGDAAHSMWASLGQGVNAALEDCQVLAQVLNAAREREPEALLDVATALKAYNERRLEDAIAVCTMSEVGMGSARSLRPAYMAQLLVVTLLNKTLGRLAPKIFTPPSIMGISGNNVTYSEVLRGVKREARILRGVSVGIVAPILAFVAKRVLLGI